MHGWDPLMTWDQEFVMCHRKHRSRSVKLYPFTRHGSSICGPLNAGSGFKRLKVPRTNVSLITFIPTYAFHKRRCKQQTSWDESTGISISIVIGIGICFACVSRLINDGFAVNCIDLLSLAAACQCCGRLAAGTLISHVHWLEMIKGRRIRCDLT